MKGEQSERVAKRVRQRGRQEDVCNQTGHGTQEIGEGRRERERERIVNMMLAQMEAKKPIIIRRAV